MAFVNRMGNLLKQTVSKHINLELSASNSSVYQTIRNMSSSKLFVGGLSYNTDDMSLKEAFSQHGEVIEARIITDRDNGRSRGFGFVTYTSSEEASRAINAWDGQDLHGRRIRVNYATEKPRGPRFDGGYGSGGGFNNFGGGGYGGPGGYGSAGGGGGYGGGNYGSGVGGSYAGRNSSTTGSYSGDGNFGDFGAAGAGGGNDNFSSGSTNQGGGFADSGYNGNTSPPYGKAEEQLSGNQGGTDAAAEDFDQETLDGNFKDDDEPNDYVNTRG